MNIDFTNKQYRLLLDIFSIADMVMNSHDNEPNERMVPYLELQQKVFSAASEFGFDDLISYDKELDGYFPTMEFENNSDDQVFMDEYDENNFWEMLAVRLAQRDLVDEIGEDAFLKMEPAERITLEDNRADRYFDEFESNGIINIRVNPEIVQ